MRLCLLALALLVGAPASCLCADDPPLIHLWANGAPGFESRKDEKEVRDRQNRNGEYRLTNVHNPYVTVFLPPKDKATGAAVVLVPGGGHRELWPIHEGENEARWLSAHGIAAVVLRYRLAREKGSPYKIAEHARQDGQRAVRLVRSKAQEWGIKRDRVGMMGFSAGGEVVALVCHAQNQGDPKSDDPIERESAQPNFQALVYSGPLGIVGQKVTKENSPPTWILVGNDDGAGKWLVPLYLALKKAGVSAELHVFAKTAHGFGYRPNRPGHRPVDNWPQLFYGFLGAQGFLKKE